MRLDRHQVREEVPPTECEVLDDEVKCIVSVLYARDWYVSNLSEASVLRPAVYTVVTLTLSIIVGRITLRISIQRSGLNLRLPSLSKSKSFVRRAQSSPKLCAALIQL